MRHEGEPPEEERPRPRPRVVDKRVSAREAREESPAPEPTSTPAREAQAPPAGGEPSAPSREPSVPSREAQGPPIPPREAEAPPTGEDGEPLWTPEQEEEAERLAQQLSEVSSRDWVVNTAVTLANVGAAKIDRGLLDDSRLAIDALSALLNAVGPQLGGAETPLRQTLAQLQFAYAQGAQPPPAQPS